MVLVKTWRHVCGAFNIETISISLRLIVFIFYLAGHGTRRVVLVSQLSRTRCVKKEVAQLNTVRNTEFASDRGDPHFTHFRQG